MKNKYPFKVKLRKNITAFLSANNKKSFKFDIIWQGKTYKAKYWWDDNNKEGIEWLYEKPNLGEKENEIMKQLLEYMEKNVDKNNINFITIEDI